ncbi:DUF2254 domain-containing protein [Vibrio gazogenes]|uniref:DUF2254 domain-containing protein n=1 Tax=Vibrio gazogenes TaxID=687 RepID=A0A1Z2SCA3_VIBGA|nr:DUF2254 domain-containing protein [Vibrio gazogenes]ASA54810.1 hypothetical protein BSQ33_03080 [Vibrio gazogenes]
MIEFHSVSQSYRKVINSIAFYPSLIAIVFLISALITLFFEYLEPVKLFELHFSYVLVDSVENARKILGILIGSIISLTVFSFSMVMVVLNTASMNLSPRLVPGLISKKSHQLVLGFYLGSIIYSTIMLINIDDVSSNHTILDIPALGILFALLQGLTSLVCFVYFIHSISQTIQVDRVLNSLFSRTKNEMNALVELHQNQDEVSSSKFEQWHELQSNTSGYFKGVKTKQLCNILEREALSLYVCVKQGYFTVEGYPFLRCNKPIKNDTQLVEEILSCFIFYVEEYISDHYSYGMTQISEIAVKAMSPGINDPGSAVKAIDMLSLLLIKRMELKNISVSSMQKNANSRLFFHEVSISELLHDNFTPIRHYARGDAFVMENILEAFKNMLFVTNGEGLVSEEIYRYLYAIISDINKNIDNHYDREVLRNMLEAISRVNPEEGDKLLTYYDKK